MADDLIAYLRSERAFWLAQRHTSGLAAYAEGRIAAIDALASRFQLVLG